MSDPFSDSPDDEPLECDELPPPPGSTHVPAGLERVPDTLQPSGTREANAQQTPWSAAGRYELQGEVARGGMGAVYCATDTTLGREVAVKVLLTRFGASTEAAARFDEEARITARLQHPGIPAVHDLGTLSDGRSFLAMKLIKGRTLEQLLKERPDPECDRARFVATFEQVCQAVGYAHSQGILHRDLKPANVMVGAFGEVQVMDWGLAKDTRNAERITLKPSRTPTDLPPPHSDSRTPQDQAALPTPFAADTTEPGTILGTVSYMPPEQAKGDLARVDARSDVFGLGGILCTILTGRPPYHGSPVSLLLVRAEVCDTDDAFRRLDASGSESELIALCKQCLSKNPADRPSDGGEVAARVAAYRAGVEERLRAAERETAASVARATEERKRRRWRQAVAALGVLLALGGVGFAWWQARAEAEFARIEGERKIEQAREEQTESTRRARNEFEAASQLDVCWSALQGDEPVMAQSALDEAVKWMAGGGADQLKPRLDRYTLDLTVLRELDRIDDLFWTADGRKLVTWRAVSEIPAALEKYGIVPGVTPTEEAVRRIAVSPIRERLIAALDNWNAVGLKPQDVAFGSGLAANPTVGTILTAVDPNPFREEVRAANRTGDSDKVARLADRPDALEQPPRFAVLLTWGGPIPMNRRKAILEGALAPHPRSLATLMALGQLDDPDPATRAAEHVRWFQAAVTARPDNPVAWNSLGVALAEGEPGAAERAFRKAIALNPAFGIAHKNLGVVLGRWKHDWDADIRCQTEAIRLDPKDADAHTNLGMAYSAKGDRKRAEECYEAALAIDPDNVLAAANLGGILIERGDLKRAFPLLRRAVEIDPTNTTAQCNLGKALVETKDYVGALLCAETAAILDPTNPQLQYNLGIARGLNRDSVGKRLALRKSADMNYVPALRELGVLNMAEGDDEGAVREYRSVVWLAPKDAQAHHEFGVVLWRTGRRGEGIAHYRIAVELDPDFVQAYKDLAVALRDTWDTAGALVAFRHLARLAPDDPRWQYLLGLALMADGRYDEALPYLIRGHEGGSKKPDWKFWSADTIKKCRALIKVGPDVAALAAGDKVPDDPLDYLLAAQFSQQHDRRYADATRLYRKGLMVRSPELPRNVDPIRYFAARSAAFAGSGKGVGPPAAEDRPRFRRSALTWMKAELADARPFAKRPDGASPLLTVTRLWLDDPAFAVLRHPFFLAVLPADEAEAWLDFWEEVRALRDTAARSTPPRVPVRP